MSTVDRGGLTAVMSAPAPDTTASPRPPVAADLPTTESPTTESPTTESPTTESPTTEDAAAVAGTFIRLMRCFNRVRSQFLSAAQHSVEWSAHVLITTLAVEGPMRSSALAESVQSDPSTVSRQIAALVKDGLVERRADPEDGRATVLAVTAKGEQVYRDHQSLRDEHYKHMLAGWSRQDVQTFAALLARFTDNIDQFSPTWLNDRLPSERASNEGDF